MAFSTATIPERVRTARILRGMSQRAFSRSIGTDQANVWAWESGRNEPRPETLLKIAKALRISMLWLAFGEGPMELPANNEPPVGAEGSSHNSAR